VFVNDAVNRAIHAAFAEHGIEFAYPTRTVYVKQ
jgi:small-conductance mechanosensitive channel